jgi:hypothetical protein
MTVEIFMLLDDILGLSESIHDMNKFCKMTEGYIFNSVKFIEDHQEVLTEMQKVNFSKAKKLLDDLESRNMYAMVYHFISKDKVDITKYIDDLPDKDDILCYQNKVGFVSGNKPNPLDSIFVYKTKNMVPSKITAHKKHKEDITLLLSQLYQEHVITVYYKNKSNKQRIKELYNYFYDIFHKD